MSKYKVTAEMGTYGFMESFNSRWYALKAVKKALKKGFVVKIERINSN